MSIVNSLSPRAITAPESGIVEVVNYARGREGLLPLWVGEGDLPRRFGAVLEMAAEVGGVDHGGHRVQLGARLQQRVDQEIAQRPAQHRFRRQTQQFR